MLPGFPEAAPLQGLIGGVLIGLAAALMLLGAGRIAGVSGILARGTAIAEGSMARTSAWGFLVGLPLGALAIRFGTDWEPAVFASWPVLVAAGFLVGFGTRMGSGCTSGHGVCGVSRLSHRSIVATTAFMAAGIATVFIMSLVGA
ncbi:YeeE/YedE family protein [Sphingobium sp. YBL2]|uniref:YeeE/YedE family protein n=1 Tax=Sphingobium sp. (strain YBL2) TaxID=484429 RepID=UPI0005CB9996|nr:YeeE/YedE thiosulfate transporter family protein [Sphingobium sp. YBL2]AJR26733.1 membrane protein [Sphingobium sp. YBL2]